MWELIISLRWCLEEGIWLLTQGFALCCLSRPVGAERNKKMSTNYRELMRIEDIQKKVVRRLKGLPRIKI